jgi:hypothetical protein
MAQQCKECTGSGRCKFCKGAGSSGHPGYGPVNPNKPECSFCKGSGTCRSCHGSGQK